MYTQPSLIVHIEIVKFAEGVIFELSEEIAQVVVANVVSIVSCLVSIPHFTAPEVMRDVELAVPPDVVSIALVLTAPVQFPTNTLPAVRVVAPVPPLATPSVQLTLILS
jgi:hypothetical protein